MTIGGQSRESIARYDQQRVEKFTGGLNPPSPPAIPTLGLDTHWTRHSCILKTSGDRSLMVWPSLAMRMAQER